MFQRHELGRPSSIHIGAYLHISSELTSKVSEIMHSIAKHNHYWKLNSNMKLKGNTYRKHIVTLLVCYILLSTLRVIVVFTSIFRIAMACPCTRPSISMFSDVTLESWSQNQQTHQTDLLSTSQGPGAHTVTREQELGPYLVIWLAFPAAASFAWTLPFFSSWNS